MALRATLDPGRSSTGEKRAGGPGKRGPGWAALWCDVQVPGVTGASAVPRTPGWLSDDPQGYVESQAALPWHWPYALPDPHQQAAPCCGGHATARPRAARVVAYWGRRVVSSGDESSEAANAS